LRGALVDGDDKEEEETTRMIRRMGVRWDESIALLGWG